MTDSAEDRDEFVQIYLEESGEEIEQLIKLLLQLEEDPDDNETLREAFRLLHTFKGSSGMMGYDRINALAHELDHLCKDLPKQRRAAYLQELSHQCT